MQCGTLVCAFLLVVLATIGSDNFQRAQIDETDKNQQNLVIEFSLSPSKNVQNLTIADMATHKLVKDEQNGVFWPQDTQCPRNADLGCPGFSSWSQLTTHPATDCWVRKEKGIYTMFLEHHEQALAAEANVTAAAAVAGGGQGEAASGHKSRPSSAASRRSRASGTGTGTEQTQRDESNLVGDGSQPLWTSRRKIGVVELVEAIEAGITRSRNAACTEKNKKRTEQEQKDEIQNNEMASAVAKALKRREELQNVIVASDNEIHELIKDYDEHVETVEEEYRTLRDCLEHEQQRMLSELRAQKTELLRALQEAKTDLQKEAIRWYTSGVPDKEAGSSEGVGTQKGTLGAQKGTVGGKGKEQSKGGGKGKEQSKGIGKQFFGKDKTHGKGKDKGVGKAKAPPDFFGQVMPAQPTVNQWLQQGIDEKDRNKGIDKSNCGKNKAEGATVCGENHSKKARKAVGEQQQVAGGLQQTKQQQPVAAS